MCGERTTHLEAIPYSKTNNALLLNAFKRVRTPHITYRARTHNHTYLRCNNKPTFVHRMISLRWTKRDESFQFHTVTSLHSCHFAFLLVNGNKHVDSNNKQKQTKSVACHTLLHAHINANEYNETVHIHKSLVMLVIQ